MAVLRAAKQVLRGAGLEVTRYPGPNTLPWKLRRVVEARPIDGVVDVGGHWGEFAKMMRTTVGYSGPIESFEPSSDSFAVMKRNMQRDARWSGQQCAIGAIRDQLDLNVFASTDGNSLRPVAVTGTLGPARTERVEVWPLDEVCTLTGKLLLKSDTQGFDLEVLAGASGVLDRTEAIVIEVPVVNTYVDAPTLIPIVQRLDDLGFELAGLFPLVMNRSDRVRVLEFDGVFIRR